MEDTLGSQKLIFIALLGIPELGHVIVVGQWITKSFVFGVDVVY